MDVVYALYENKLGNGEGKYFARVLPKETLDLDTIIEDMRQMGARGSVEDLQHDFHLYYQAIVNRVADGNRVNLLDAHYRLSIKGVFDSPADTFNSARHTIAPSVSPGSLLRDLVSNQATVAKKESNPTAPRPQVVTDHTTKIVDQTLTRGGPAELTGYRLRFDIADPQQGVFLVENTSESETRAEVYMRNNPKSLMFMIPTTLTPGVYRLEVRYKPLIEGIRQVGVLPKLLTINGPI